MDWNKLQDNRLAVVAHLVANAPGNPLGRTALMKLCYFLQTLRNVPLRYRFSMYSYGPFAADVLSDLGTAVNLQGVVSRIEYNNIGYGYRLQPGDCAAQLERDGAEFLEEHRAHLDWVLNEFGTHCSSDLEIESTIVFVDREAARKAERPALSEIASRVGAIKPQFTEAYILGKAQDLEIKGLLTSARPEQATAAPMAQSA